MLTRKGLVIAACALASVAAAQGQGKSEGGSELDIFAYESQLSQVSVSSTKSEQRGSQTPAVITVVSAEEIQLRGYTSLAEVLRSVPGLYDVYDLVTHNVGVRGVNGGADASGNVLKV